MTEQVFEIIKVMKSSSFSELKSHLIGDQAESSRTLNWNHSRTYDQNAVSKPKDLSDRFAEQFLDEQFQRPESFSMKGRFLGCVRVILKNNKKIIICLFGF